MRKLLALLAVLTMVSAAHAENNFNMSSEFRLRATNDQNTTGNDDNGLTQNRWDNRLKLGMDFNAGEKFSAHGTFLHNSHWGQDLTGVTNPTGDSGTAIHDGVGTGQNMLLVNEAYGTWLLNDSTALRFGRGAMTIGDGSVVSVNEWEATPYAFDGAMVTHDMEFGRLSGFYVKFTDWNLAQGQAVVGPEDPETNAYGLNLDIKAVPDVIKMLNVHVIKVKQDEFQDGATHVPGEDTMRYGLTVAGETMGLDFRATYASYTGEHISELGTGSAAANQDISSNMMDAEIGYTLADVMGFLLHFLYHSDTGNSTGATDDETYDSFFYEKHKNGGLMDVFGWGNLTYMQAGVSLAPMDSMTVGLNYIMFSQTEKAGGVIHGANGSAFGTVAAAGGTHTELATEDDLGTEIDLWATKKYDNGFEITARYSMFTPGDEFKTANPATTQEDSYNQIELEARMTF
mgnify:CR=1 FL=1